jgi:homoserine kinase type II
MAVYTEIGDDDLARVLAAYDIGEPLALKGIAEGVENSNYFLQTTRGRYFLTLYEKRVAEGDLPFFMGLLEHVAARGVNCPRPLHGHDGEIVRHIAGRPAALVTFLDGVSPKRPNAAQCGEAGDALARLHEAGQGFAIRRANALSVGGWPPLVASCEPRANEVAPGLSETITSELAFLQGAWPAGLPEGVIHADLFPDNALFVGDRLTGVIDFYFACNDAFAYDVAICLNAWCFEGDNSFNITKARALLARYQAVRTLSPEELAALPVLARGSALRFLLTRLHDWLNHDPKALVRPKSPLEYLAKLRFHQHVNDSGGYGL